MSNALTPCLTVAPSLQVIYQYILDRKVDIERELKAWEAQQATEASEEASKQRKDHDARIEEFVARQEGLSKSDLASRQPAGASKGAVGAVMGRRLLDDKGAHAPDTSFWVPQLTPQAKARLDKPDGVVRCPFTTEPLKLKHLYPVHFTPADAGASAADILSLPKNERYICPLTKKALSNVNPAALLRPSGKVFNSLARVQFPRTC